MINRVLTGLATLLLSGWLFAAGNSHEEALVDRIKPSGQVCVQGEECAVASTAATSASSGPMSGAEVYQKACFGCHGTGAGGAPKVGVAADWTARIAQGNDTMVANAINGFTGSKGVMPAKGLCATCSDDEISAAVTHMVENSQ